MPRAVVRILIPTTALAAERARIEPLLDALAPDLAPWDEGRFLREWPLAAPADRVAWLDWVRRCHARAPLDLGCARQHARALVALRFPWLALVICRDWLGRVGGCGRLDPSILRAAVLACVAVGRIAEARSLLGAVRGPLPESLRPLWAEIERGESIGKVWLFPGPGPSVVPRAFPEDALELLEAWLEAVEERQLLLADRLFEHALAAREEPRWAEQLLNAGIARVPGAWPSLQLARPMIAALDEVAGLDTSAVKAARVVRVLAHLACFYASHPEEMDESAALILRQIRAGWRPAIGSRGRAVNGRRR